MPTRAISTHAKLSGQPVIVAIHSLSEISVTLFWIQCKKPSLLYQAHETYTNSSPFDHMVGLQGLRNIIGVSVYDVTKKPGLRKPDQAPNDLDAAENARILCQK